MNPPQPVRLLVCDPDPQCRKMIEDYLRDSSFRVYFTSPSEPFEITLSRHSPLCAVIMDLSNPAKRSCGAMMAAVKKASPGAEVIFLSRLADEILWSEVLSMGAYDLLPKPVERMEFLRSVFGAVHDSEAA